MHNEHTAPRRKLVDILDGNANALREQWDRTQAAEDFQPVPPGHYVCHVHAGELESNRKGTPQYMLVFRIVEGEHAGRQLWHPLYLTPAALPMAKRDLGKLGVTDLDQLERPLLPGRIRCKVRVALRRDDNGTEYNRVRRFDVLGVDEPEADPFAPSEDAEGDATPADDGDTSFPYGANADPQAAGSAPQRDGAAPPEGGDS